MTPSFNTPSEAISSFMKERGWTQKELADKLGVSRQTANYILNGRNELTGKMMLRLNKLTGLPVEYWHDLQSQQRKTSEKEQNATFKRAFPGTLIDSEITAAIQSKALSISGFDPAYLGATQYCLHVGTHIIGSDGSLQNQGVAALKKGVRYTIETLEELSLPAQMSAQIEIVQDLGEQGFLNLGSTCLSPGHEGPLEILLLSLAEKEIHLATQDPLCLIRFEWLSGVPEHVIRAQELQAIDQQIDELDQKKSSLLAQRQHLNSPDHTQ